MDKSPATAETDGRLRFEGLVTRLAADFVNTPAEAVDARIEGALQQLVLFLDLDRSTLAQAEEGVFRITHSWAREGISPAPLLATDSLFPWGIERLRRGEPVAFSCLDELPPEASKDRESFRRFGPRSLACFPLVASGEPVGLVAFGTLTREIEWSPAVLGRLGLVAGVFAGALERKRNELRLRDALTQVEQLKERLEAENVALRENVEELAGHDEIVGVSYEITSVLHQVDLVAPTDSTALLLGETGTGKELIARAIHRRSRRRDKNLIVVNCAALPASLIESELFGHEKGAFTGALTRKIGRFELADGGTIFLDEVGELTPELQAKLLRVLQQGEFERLGSTETRKTDARVLAATNRDLEKSLADGTFRSDLYYRLRVFPILVPPLRERREDIPLLVWHTIGRLRGELGSRIQQVPDWVMERLRAYSWPGNVRELQNVIEHAMIISQGPELELLEGFGDRVRAPTRGREPETGTLEVVEQAATQGREPGTGTLEAVERAHIVRTLKSCDWRVSGKGNAAERLGLNPSTLRSRMRRLEIKRP